MSDYPQYPDPQAAGAQQSGSQTGPSYRRLAGAIDPRKAIDPATVERMIHAQVAARAQAQAATTVVLATIVSLITSAFSFVAALAWNSAIQQLLSGKSEHSGLILWRERSREGGVLAIYAIIVTVIAVVVVLMLNRIAKRYASKSALGNN